MRNYLPKLFQSVSVKIIRNYSIYLRLTNILNIFEIKRITKFNFSEQMAINKYFISRTDRTLVKFFNFV